MKLSRPNKIRKIKALARYFLDTPTRIRTWNLRLRRPLGDECLCGLQRDFETPYKNHTLNDRSQQRFGGDA